MRDDRLEIGVTFDSARGYIASAPELRAPVVALSLGGLRRRIEAALMPNAPIIVLQLDALAERHRRQALATASSAGTLSPASVQPPDKAQALRSVQYA